MMAVGVALGVETLGRQAYPASVHPMVLDYRVIGNQYVGVNNPDWLSGNTMVGYGSWARTAIDFLGNIPQVFTDGVYYYYYYRSADGRIYWYRI